MVANIGRRAAFSTKAIQLLKTHQTLKDKRQDSATSQSLNQLLRDTQLATQSNPNFIAKALSRSTLRKYRNQVTPVKSKGGVNTDARASALIDLRNHVSGAVVSKAALLDMRPELIFNTDVVKIYLADNKPPTILLTEDGEAWLKQRYMQHKTKQKTEQRRVIDLNVTTSADGSVLHTAIEIRDHQVGALKYWRVDDEISLWLYPKTHNYCDTIAHFYENTLIPLVEKKRHKLALELLDPATPSNLNAPAAEFNPDIKDLDACKKSLRACFSLDGAQAQTDAFMKCGLGDICKQHSIEYLKWAASSSGFQQPNDVATCHKDVKAANELIKYDDELPPYVSPVMLKVIDQLSTSGITGSSLKTFSKFLSFSSLLIDKAFTKLAVQKGWKSAGFFPHDTSRILSRCSEWETLTKLQSDRVLQEISALTQIALVNGQVTDAQIESQLAGSGIVFIGKVKKESMAVSRLRAVWGNNDIFVATQVEIAAVKEEEAQEVEKKRETKLLAKQLKEEKAATAKAIKAQKLAEKEAQQAAAQFPCVGASCHLFYNLAKGQQKRHWQQCDTCEQMCCMQAVCKDDLNKHEASCKAHVKKADKLVAPVAKNSKLQSSRTRKRKI